MKYTLYLFLCIAALCACKKNRPENTEQLTGKVKSIQTKFFNTASGDTARTEDSYYFYYDASNRLISIKIDSVYFITYVYDQNKITATYTHNGGVLHKWEYYLQPNTTLIDSFVETYYNPTDIYVSKVYRNNQNEIDSVLGFYVEAYYGNYYNLVERNLDFQYSNGNIISFHQYDFVNNQMVLTEIAYNNQLSFKPVLWHFSFVPNNISAMSVSLGKMLNNMISSYHYTGPGFEYNTRHYYIKYTANEVIDSIPSNQEPFTDYGKIYYEYY